MALPASAAIGLARLRTRIAWRDEDVRRRGERQMHLLLDDSSRADDATRLARQYVENMLVRNELRWHPARITHQRIENLDVLTGRDTSRALLLSFMHHGWYFGAAASLAQHGVPITSIMRPGLLDPDGPPAWRQVGNVAKLGGPTVPVTVGTTGICERLQPGVVMRLAADVPGSATVMFLGREFRNASGTPHVARMTNTPVAVMTSHLGDDGDPYLRLHEPIEPADFDDPADMRAEILRRHEPAVLAWPEAVEQPWKLWHPVQLREGERTPPTLVPLRPDATSR